MERINWPPEAAQESHGGDDIKYDVVPTREVGLDGSDPSWYYIYGDVMGEAMESAITVKGQATIPKAVREHLGLKPGDRVKFFLHPDGTVVLLPKLPVRALRGILRRSRRPVSIERMHEAIAEGAAGVRQLTRRR
jgi:AbrB family looped-hinge helix DNA binding protein